MSLSNDRPSALPSHFFRNNLAVACSIGWNIVEIPVVVYVIHPRPLDAG
jgi:hypothetical protein